MLVCLAVPQRASGFILDHHFPRLTALLSYLNPALHIVEKKFHFWLPWRWPTLLWPPRLPSVRLICHHGRMSIDKRAADPKKRAAQARDRRGTRCGRMCSNRAPAARLPQSATPSRRRAA